MTKQKLFFTLFSLFASAGIAISQIVPAPTDGPSISIVSGLPVGSNSGVTFVPSDETVWVDLNDNGICDRGEHVSWGVAGKIVVKNYHVITPKVTIYGPVQRFLMRGMEILSVQVHEMHDMVEFQCFNNKIDVLGMDDNRGLLRLFCFNNKISSLDLSNCPLINDVRCFSNQINDTEMTKLITSLPKKNKNNAGLIIAVDTKDEAEKNVCSRDNVRLAYSKWWTVNDLNGDRKTWIGIPYEGSTTYVEQIVQSTPTAYFDASTQQIVLLNSSSGPWQLYSVNGQLRDQGYLELGEKSVIEVSSLSRGIYFIDLGGEVIKVFMD